MASWRVLTVLVALVGVAACGTDSSGDDADDQGSDHDDVHTDDDLTGQGDGLGGDGLLPGDGTPGDGTGPGDGPAGDDDGNGGDSTGTGDDGPAPGDDPPFVPVATSLIAVSDTTLSARAGAEVTDAPEVEVRDQAGGGMAGVVVHFELTAGGGAIAPTNDLVTNSQGRAKLGAWQLGKSRVPQRVRASVPALAGLGTREFTAEIATGYDITVIVIGDMTTSQRAAFASARARWEAVIVNDFPDIAAGPDGFSQANLTPDERCGAAADPEAESIPIDDIIIFARVGHIDGPSNVLANAGPCYTRSGSGGGVGAPVVGIMNFDEDDIGQLETDGSFDEVILHEMGHVLGIGTFWGPLIQNPSSPLDCEDPNDHGNPGANTIFTGPLSAEAFTLIGGTGFPSSVPADNTASCGSADAHWRESIFGIELMSPSIAEGQNSLPMSVVTIASLYDIGFYEPNFEAADAFSLTSGLRGPVAPERGHCDAVPVTELTPVAGGFYKAR